jgi:hypothetical protein
MGKIIGSVVAGYVTMFVLVFVLFSVAYMVLGASGAFKEGSWDVSFAWLLSSIVVGLVAAIAGGWVCGAIAKDAKGPNALAVVVLLIGLLMALSVLLGSAEVATAVRSDTVGMFDAMQNAKQPSWIALLNPLLGAVGVMIGAKLKGS